MDLLRLSHIVVRIIDTFYIRKDVGAEKSYHSIVPVRISFEIQPWIPGNESDRFYQNTWFPIDRIKAKTNVRILVTFTTVQVSISLSSPYD